MKYTPEEYAEKAGELFHEGYNCAQAVVAVFADEVGLDMDTAMKFGASFAAAWGKCVRSAARCRAWRWWLA